MMNKDVFNPTGFDDVSETIAKIVNKLRERNKQIEIKKREIAERVLSCGYTGFRDGDKCQCLATDIQLFMSCDCHPDGLDEERECEMSNFREDEFDKGE